MNEKQKQVFAILGVQPEEYFTLSGSATRFWLTSKLDVMMGEKGCGGRLSTITLQSILNGDYKINKLPWTPANGEWYYHVDREGDISNTCFYYFDRPDIMRARLGNCYRTKEEITPEIKEFWKNFFHSTERINWK